MAEPWKVTGARVRKRRLSLHLSLEIVGAKLRLSAGYLSDIERGNRCPSYSTLQGLARVLQLDADDLCAGWKLVPPNLAELITRDANTIKEVRELLRENP